MKSIAKHVSPPPCTVLREYSIKQWSDNTRQAKNSTNQTHIDESLGHWENDDKDGVDSTRDARSASALNGPFNNEASAVEGDGCHATISIRLCIPNRRYSQRTADQRSNLEYKDRRQESVFDEKIFECLVSEGYESRKGQKEGTSVPTDLAQALEILSDLENWDRNDALEEDQLMRDRRVLVKLTYYIYCI